MKDMRLSEFLRMVFMMRMSDLIAEMSSVFLPVISKMAFTLSDKLPTCPDNPPTLPDNRPTLSDNPSTLSDKPYTFSRTADKPSPNILKSERKDSKTTANSLSLYKFDFLFFNLGPFIFSKFTAMGGPCQGKRSHKIMTGWKLWAEQALRLQVI